MDSDEDSALAGPEKNPGLVAREGGPVSPRKPLPGGPATIEQCRKVLLEGYQRQRIAAALELAGLQPGSPLFETRAPGWRQQKQLPTPG